MGVVIRQSVKGSFVNYVGAFIGFLTTFIFVTRFLTPGEYGLTRVLIESAMLVAALAQVGTTASIIKFFPYFKSAEKKHNGFFGLSMLVPFFGLIFFCILYILLKQPVVALFEKESALFLNYFYYVIPFAVFFVYVGVFETYSSVLHRIVVPRFIREVGVRVMTIVVYLLWGFRLVTFDQFVLLFILVYGAAAVLNLMYVFALKQYSFKPNMEIAKPLQNSFFKYTAFLLPAAIGGTITIKMDTFMVSSMLGLDQMGVFSIAYWMAVIIDIPYRSLNAISQPVVSNHLKDEDYKSVDFHYKKVSLNQLLIGCLLFILIWVNIDSIYKILPNGEDYVGGKYVVLFIALSRLVDSGFNFGLSVLSLSKYYYYYLFFIFFLALLTFVSNYLLIPVYGISGAALATFISFIIYNLLVIIIVYKTMKVSPFSEGQLKIAALTGVLLVLNFFIPSLTNPYIEITIRGLLLGGIFIFVAYFWKISQDANHVIRVVIRRVKMSAKK